MPTPQEFNDDELVRLMAEMLAWPDRTGVVNQKDAMRKAIAHIPGSDRWSETRVSQTMGRLKKRYPEIGHDLQVRAEARGYPLWPPAVINTPAPPDARHSRLEAQSLADELEAIVQLATGLRTALTQQFWNGTAVDPDLRDKARKLVAAVAKQQGKNL